MLYTTPSANGATTTVTRLTVTGSVDPTFGTGGVAAVPASGAVTSAPVDALAVDAAGRPVVVGYLAATAGDAYGDALVARFGAESVTGPLNAEAVAVDGGGNVGLLAPAWPAAWSAACSRRATTRPSPPAP